MTEPGTTCPSGLTQTGYININHDVCGQPNPSIGGRASTLFSTYSIIFSKVCGQVRRYQYRQSSTFNTGTTNVDSYYVDGVSITYGSKSRQHIWTYASGTTEIYSTCPCNSGSRSSAFPPPPLVCNDYYCESGVNDFPMI